MKQTRFHMGMPITVEVVDAEFSADDFNFIFNYFASVDARYSPFKDSSLVGRINSGQLHPEDAGEEMQTILLLAELTRQQTNGYFNIYQDGHFNPSGIVKGWAIQQAANMLRERGMQNYYVDAGGDMAVRGTNWWGQPWRIGIRNPFDTTQIIKTVALTDGGIATSGLYQRGKHIYNPHDHTDAFDHIASVTVIGPTVLDADRFATAAFAMGADGIYFLEELAGIEGYAVDHNGLATMTRQFPQFVAITDRIAVCG